LDLLDRQKLDVDAKPLRNSIKNGSGGVWGVIKRGAAISFRGRGGFPQGLS
jgi:hypothetical protein